MSTAQSRAVMNYYNRNKDRIHKISITIYDSKEPELFAWLESQNESRGAVIKRLIREEIARTGWKPKGK